VRFSVAANTSTTARTGAITIGGQIFNVSQPGMSNQPPVPPSNLRIVKGG
jgi:hypothetical protein